MAITRVEELRVYGQSFEAAMHLFELSKQWPAEERYALTDQIRRSSRAVCANLAEAWRKRRYVNHFVSKLSDADAEATETRTWIRFARDCCYLPAPDAERLDQRYDRICGGLVTMMQDPEPWCGPSALAPTLPSPHAPALPRSRTPTLPHSHAP
ncbi:MAG: four helix bundle protein [Bacteroidetes bacterium]|nr:four helix bundle protein [Bacteroidota bacterium]